MPITQLPIANGFYVSESLPLSAQECTNLYPQIPDAPALSPDALFFTPGLTQVASVGPSVVDANRGALVMEGVPYFVNGQALYSLDSLNTPTNIGTILGTRRVSMAENGDQLMILVPGAEGYIYTLSTNTLVQITDSDFTANGNPQYVVFIDSYFLCVTDDKKFIISSQNDGTSWNALDFGSAESSPDEAVAPYVFRNQLYIGGGDTTEGFNNIGGSGFPFQRNGIFFDEGVIAPLSVIASEGEHLFIGSGKGEGPAVWACTGNDTQKISTQAIDRVLQELSQDELQMIHSWSYGQVGHYFVGFVLPNTTFVYDSATRRWHERKSRVLLANGDYEIQTYRVSAMVAAYGRIYCPDLLDGRIGVLDLETYSEYDERVVRAFSTQPFQNNMQPFFVPKLELTVESGVGNSDEPDPMVRLEVSRDGGKTYSDERVRPMGKIGEYFRRAVWRRNGRSARFDVYRFTVSAPVKVVILQLTAEIEGRDSAAA